MEYTPRPIRDEVNVSPEHPLREFFLLAGGLLGGLLVLYLVLGFILNLVVPRIDPSLEEYLGNFFLASFTQEEKPTTAGQRLQALLDDLVHEMEAPTRKYRVHLVPSREANAFALPGGHIVVMSGLVLEALSENELSMIIGHELGHFRNRDHLRGLGRGLVLVVFSSVLFGADSALSRLSATLLGSAEMKFSQRQELQADARGLELLVKKYGHAGGATDFFRRVGEKEKGNRLTYFFASHPYPP